MDNRMKNFTLGSMENSENLMGERRKNIGKIAKWFYKKVTPSEMEAFNFFFILRGNDVKE
jgi:hypothetical protein